MTTITFKGKTYKVVADTPDEGCTECAFYNIPGHAHDDEMWEGDKFSDRETVGCIDGKHHYMEEKPE